MTAVAQDAEAAPAPTSTAVVYLRGSDDESDTSHQRFLCMEYAGKNGFHVGADGVYDEGGGYSGKKLVRVKFDEMLHRVMERRDVEAIILYKFDRALRKIKYLLELKDFCERHRVALISISQNIDTGTSEGKAFFAIGGAFAEMEWDMASQRIRDAYRHVLSEHGTRPSASWRAKDKPVVSAKWGRKPGSKDKQPRTRRWFRKPAEAVSPLETVSVGDLQTEMRRLNREIAAAELEWASLPPGEARERLLAEIDEKRRRRDARAEVVLSVRTERPGAPPGPRGAKRHVTAPKVGGLLDGRSFSCPCARGRGVARFAHGRENRHSV